MRDLENNNVIKSETTKEFGDCEAAKLASVLHDRQPSFSHPLQQTIKMEKLSKKKAKRQDGNYFRLGPCFNPEDVEDSLDSLKECFPAKFSKPPFLNDPEKLNCHWVKSSNKPTNGWTCSIDTSPWFNRLSSRHDVWRKLRIYEFLRLSTYPRFPFYDALTAGLVCCWNPCLNVFITGQGFRTITLEDIAFLTGLSPTGIDVPTQSLIDGALDMEKIQPWKNKSNMAFSAIADYYNPTRNKSLSSKISRKEEVLFINFAFSKMMMFPSCNVNKTFLKLAANIEASGLDPKKVEPLCLGTLFLGQVYRSLYRLRTNEKLYTAGGPVWIISMWGLFHFPFLARQKGNAKLDYEELEAEFDKSTAVPVNECCCYGEVTIHSVSPVVHLSFEEVLRGLLGSCELTQSDWYPFAGKDEKVIPLYLHDANGTLLEDTAGEWMKKAAPDWLLKLSCTSIQEVEQPHWLSVLQARDLMCIEPKVIGVEVYNPNLVARQFGMTQGLSIPFYKTLNRPWGTRPNIVDVAPKSGDNKYVSTETWLKSVLVDEVSPHHVSPWCRWAATDPGYELWWTEFLQRSKASWSEALATLVERVQGRPPIDPILSNSEASSYPKGKSTWARIPIVCSLSNSLRQMENSARGSLTTNGQKRKSDRIMIACTSSKKANVEDVDIPDDDALLKSVRKRAIRSRHTAPPDSFANGCPEPAIASLFKDLEHYRSNGKLRSVNSQRDASIQGNRTPQSLEADGSNNHLNTPKFCERRNGKDRVTTREFERGDSQTTTDFNVGMITSEEAAVETVAPEPEDSLEPPHEMVRGMGSHLNTSCLILSGEAWINPSLNSPHRTQDLSSFKEEETEEVSGAHDPVTPDISRALIVNSSSLAETSLQLLSLEGVPYTPDKALAEVNSVVSLIEDTLRPFPTPSAFDVEKGKAEEIVNALQSNVRDLEAYANLADQVHRLLVVSPPQFRPILAHYESSFMSLRDQLRNIREQEDSTTCNADALHGLSTEAKTLRDRLQTSQTRIDQLREECSQFDTEIDELEAKLVILKQVRENKQQELAIEEEKFNQFSATWSETIPLLQEVAKTMVTAHQTKAQWECTMKAIKDNVHSFLGLLRTM